MRMASPVREKADWGLRIRIKGNGKVVQPIGDRRCEKIAGRRPMRRRLLCAPSDGSREKACAFRGPVESKSWIVSLFSRIRTTALSPWGACVKTAKGHAFRRAVGGRVKKPALAA